MIGSRDEAAGITMTDKAHTIHLVGDNPGGEVIRTTRMGTTTVKVLDRAVYEKALAAAGKHMKAMRERLSAEHAKPETGL